MNDLISRLSAAAEGSADLDRDFLLARGWRPARSRGLRHMWRRPDGMVVAMPTPTRSLDDITRMIEGAGMEWMWFLGHMDPTDMRFSATISERGNIGVPTWRGFHVVAPLAMCIAFLRAKEAANG